MDRDATVRRLTVLYDAGCPICRLAKAWLGAQAHLVPLEFVAAGSDAARRRFAGLDHAASRRDITVVADTGAVYRGDAAWLVCLWALDSYRALSFRLAQPGLRGSARRVVAAAAAARRWTRTGPGEADYGDACDETCTAPG